MGMGCRSGYGFLGVFEASCGLLASFKGGRGGF